MIKHAYSHILLLLFTIIFPSSCYAQLPKKELTQLIEKNMKIYHIPGVSIAVIKNYQLEWIAGFGMADKIHQQPVTPTTKFQAGSISKPVTAMAALRAVQDKKILLRENINRYLKSWKLPENKWTATQPVTLRELLNHSAGITVHGFIGYAENQKIPSLIEVLNGVSPANSPPVRVSAIPGEKFNYSGGGYIIIQQALVDVYHQSFTKLMQTLVLQPLKMSHSTFQQPLPLEQLKGIAMPYRPDGTVVTGGPHTYVEQAAAGLWTTPADLAKFVISIQQSLAGNQQVLNLQEAELMITPSINKNMGLGFEIGVNQYGKSTENGHYFMHMGENEGYRSILIANTKNGDGLVIMTNMSPDSDLVLQHKITDDWSFFFKIISQIANSEKWK